MDASTLWMLMQTAVAQAAQDAPALAEGVSGADWKVMIGGISAALVMAIGAFGPGSMEGYAAAKACEGIARNPESAGPVTRAMIIGQAVTESTVVYCLIIAALILVFVVM